MNWGRVKGNLRSYGVAKTIQDLGLRALNRVMVLKILKGIKIEKADPGFLQCGGRYRGLFLDGAALREFSSDPAHDLPPRFVEGALEKGDECYAILDGCRLAAYGWYSSRPTGTDLPGLRVHFDPSYIYMYKGFTHCDYRGRRLHAVGMTRALSAYLERGYRGIISYVYWENFASLSSCYRMGYEDFGRGYVVGLGGRYLLYSSPGCRRYDFRLERDGRPGHGG